MNFHPAVASWFEERFGEPTAPQEKGWPLIQEGKNVLLASPTGSGKTLAAFLCAIDGLVRQASTGGLENRLQVLYVSPLKALANDIQVNLLDPLAGVIEKAAQQGLELPPIRALVRTGDTPQSARRKMLKDPPHILVTTPESLFILLTTQRGRAMLGSVDTVIVDEIHALARDKRGAHLTLSLERLEALRRELRGPATAPCQRIGLSATQKPLQRISNFLCGANQTAEIVNVGHRRELKLAIETTGDELTAVASHQLWEEIYDRIAALANERRTTLIFVNTRKLAERLTHHLAQRLGDGNVAAHHGSLARERRLDAERRLKAGELRAVVATASLELGIDVGTVDLVCQIGSTRSIALALQRVGRSGHWKGATPEGRFFPLTRDELVECAALVRAIRQGHLDEVSVPPAPLDVLAQQIVAAAASREWSEDELFQTLRAAMPYKQLERARFDAVVTMLAEGLSSRQGRRRSYLHRDRINGRIRGRRGARLAALTSGGAIADIANFVVRADPEDIVVGDLDEDFALESNAGDIFLLGNTSWRIRRIESGVVRVEDARGAPPSIPFWRGEAPARTPELSEAFCRLRQEVLAQGKGAVPWLQKECSLDKSGARQLVAYVRHGAHALGVLPTQRRIVAERFFDEAGGMQLILHAPFGGRINRAWGLALRKRFCRSFNFELQAAATENGLLLSLSDQHSFPLDSVFSFLTRKTGRHLLIQALLDVPMFQTRWRWTATRALAVLRFAGGRKVPPQLQRIRADDLLASIFPDSAACLENIVGDIEIPDHPLVAETLSDCLNAAMDVTGWEDILAGIEEGTIETVAVDTREPSPFCHELLNANPYAFLDPAGLEERRTRAISTPYGLPAEELRRYGRLDEAAIEKVASQLEPYLDNPDEMHDALLSRLIVAEEEWPDIGPDVGALIDCGRAFRLLLDQRSFVVASERLSLARTIYSNAALEPDLGAELEKKLAPLWERDAALGRSEAIVELLRCQMESSVPQSASRLARRLALVVADVNAALAALEAEGQLLQGHFTPGQNEVEWCDRHLLARLHRLTLGRLRREIEPVSPADFVRFLGRWQHLEEGTRLHGGRGLRLVLGQLQGFEAPAVAWEASLLAARVEGYQPEMLDKLCSSGQFVWGRLSQPAKGNGQARIRPTQLAPIAFFRRGEIGSFLSLDSPAMQSEPSVRLSHPAREVFDQLQEWGASFVEDLVRTCSRLPMEVEEGLWELVTAGLVTADTFDNLRSLIDPKRRLLSKHRRLKRRDRQTAVPMGRWSRLMPPGRGAADSDTSAVEVFARQLLRRWGVVFKALLKRESLAPTWWELLRVYRLWEARGEIRGGRFVKGFTGEQFALGEAVDTLRRVRRTRPTNGLLTISAADPLNLVGIVLPGERVRPHPKTVINYRDGVLVEPSRSRLKVEGSGSKFRVSSF